MDNKYEKIKDWVSDFPQLESKYVDFNVINMQTENVSVNSVQSQNIVSDYVNGWAKKELLFAVIFVKPYDYGTSDININAIEDSLEFAKWVEEQNRIKNLPVFKDCIMYDVEMLEITPNIAIDNDAGLAKYMIQGKTTFLERR